MSERLTRTTLPSPTLPPLLLVLSRPLLGLSSPLLLLLSQSLVGASECAPMHRCIASTPLHYDSYIAIFIISAAHWCPRSHLTSVVSSPLVFFPFSLRLLAFEPLSFFWQITAGEFKASRRRDPRAFRDRSMENSLEEIPPGVYSRREIVENSRGLTPNGRENGV